MSRILIVSFKTLLLNREVLNCTHQLEIFKHVSTNYGVHCELRVPWFQLPLKWASWGGTEATALASCFLLSLVEAKDGRSRFPLFKASQLIHQWWILCNLMAQSLCSLLNENNFQFRRILGRTCDNGPSTN